MDDAKMRNSFLATIVTTIDGPVVTAAIHRLL